MATNYQRGRRAERNLANALSEHCQPHLVLRLPFSRGLTVLLAHGIVFRMHGDLVVIVNTGSDYIFRTIEVKKTRKHCYPGLHRLITCVPHLAVHMRSKWHFWVRGEQLEFPDFCKRLIDTNWYVPSSPWSCRGTPLMTWPYDSRSYSDLEMWAYSTRNGRQS